MTEQKIREYNSLILEKFSLYLNCAERIVTPDLIEQTREYCRVGKEEAFRIVLAGALDLYENKDIMSLYMRHMIKQLSPDKYTSNPYYKNVKLDCIENAEWKIEKKSYMPYEGFVFNDLSRLPDGRIIPQIGFFDEEFFHPCITERGREWMLITPNEIETMARPIERAHGDVITYGMGLGYFAYMASEKQSVSSVTIVEKDRRVIEIFKAHILPQFKCADKINIIERDACDFAAEKHKCDFVFADIWHDPSDGIELYKKLKMYEKADTEYAYWIEDTIKCYL